MQKSSAIRFTFLNTLAVTSANPLFLSCSTPARVPPAHLRNDVTAVDFLIQFWR